MEVRLLGPTEVFCRGVPVSIGARLQRVVLAILALEEGRVVPAERLIEQLSSGSPPAKTTASLHATVAYLRRALEPGFARRWALVLALMDGDVGRVRALVTL